jgi:hypothetical protein
MTTRSIALLSTAIFKISWFHDSREDPSSSSPCYEVRKRPLQALMSSAAIPTIVLASPPGLASLKGPPDFGLSLLPTVVSIVVVLCIAFATIWLHNSEKTLILENEYNQAMHAGEDIANNRTGYGVSMHHHHLPPSTVRLQPGPEYGSPEMPAQAFMPPHIQQPRRPSEWSHTIGTDNLNRGYSRENGENTDPRSGIGYNTPSSQHSVPSSGPGQSRTPIQRPKSKQRLYPPMPPLPKQAPIYDGSHTNAQHLGLSGRAEWQGGNGMFGTGRESMMSDWTVTTNDGNSSPSQLVLGSEYQGSMFTDVNPARPLSENYTAISRGRG